MSDKHFGAALESHAGSEGPFKAARTRLLLGSRMRRDGQRVAAREHLRHGPSGWRGGSWKSVRIGSC